MYGAHEWHLDQCKGEKIGIIKLGRNDNLICHYFLPNWENIIPRKFQGKKIYSCHETEVFPVRNIPYKKYDKIHYVSNFQKEWHNIDHSSVIVPNVVDPLFPNEEKQYTKVAGIIGSIDTNKQTHISIQRAIDDGMVTIILFGKISDYTYFLTIHITMIK
jgi:hypothetical protein